MRVEQRAIAYTAGSVEPVAHLHPDGLRGRLTRRLLRCASALGWQALQPVSDEYMTTRIRFDPEQLLPQIFQDQQTIERLWRGDVDTLIMSHELLHATLRSTRMQEITMYTRVPLSLEGLAQAIGLRVVVVPWISGWILVRGASFAEAS